MSASSRSNTHSSSLENPISMHEQFYRSTSVREFLNKYLKPGGPQLPPNGKDLKSVKAISHAQKESGMYKRIVSDQLSYTFLV